MQVAKINKKYNSQFGNAFYDTTSALNSSIVLSRALVDGCGATIPWIIMANNGTERKEKARRLLFDYSIAYLSPFLTLPFTNRLAIKYVSKLTKGLWANNHKAITISNKFLKDADSMMNELKRISKGTEKYPLEALFNRIFPNKKYEQKINIDELLKSCGGDKEKLRQKIIKAKNAVFIFDCLFTFGLLGSVPFINNEITRKQSGQAGFSAEMNMADKEIVENRAKEYEKSKHKKYLAFLSLFAAITLGMSLAGFASLYPNSKNCGKFINYFRNRAKYFDYKKGIYMSRLPFFLGYIADVMGVLFASRNETEKKDVMIRQSFGSAVFFGGDLLLGSLFTNISDRLFGTKLRSEEDNSSFINKIFPKIKSLSDVIDEVEQGKISRVNKKVCAGIFWVNMFILMGSLGYFIPKLVNKMIRRDVEKDVNAQNKINLYTRPRMEDFVKGEKRCLQNQTL